ncbi:hypothetical protein glysoja_040191 [Glycine soja]|uniref:Uncharacterized protein n=1 Tax=Glycine soja TaxID=3848 RepID=A0A0B2S2C1_GLYSO|nr:hypothetical protein glysoja_040191 [Glycine soja]
MEEASGPSCHACDRQSAITGFQEDICLYFSWFCFSGSNIAFLEVFHIYHGHRSLNEGSIIVKSHSLVFPDICFGSIGICI